MTYSAVLILPAALRDAGNQIAVALGHDGADPPDTYNVPLYPIGGGDEPTHYATHAWAQQKFKDDVEAAAAGTPPEGFTPEQAAAVTDVVAHLVYSFVPLGDIVAAAHFDSVASAHGLERQTISDGS